MVAAPKLDRETIAHQITEAAFLVHSAIGPGLKKSVYEQCLEYELQTRGLALKTKVAVPVVYRNIPIDGGFEVDMVVEGAVAVEIRAIERIMPIDEVQLLTYLKFSGHGIGLLINFNVPLIKHGMRRLLRQAYYHPPLLIGAAN